MQSEKKRNKLRNTTKIQRASFRLVVISDRPTHTAVNHRRLRFSSRRCSCLERSATGRHVCAFSTCFLKATEVSSLQALFPVKSVLLHRPFGQFNSSSSSSSYFFFFFFFFFFFLLLLLLLLDHYLAGVCNKSHSPLTVSLADTVTVPTVLDALQEYDPASLVTAFLMVRTCFVSSFSITIRFDGTSFASPFNLSMQIKIIVVRIKSFQQQYYMCLMLQVDKVDQL